MDFLFVFCLCTHTHTYICRNLLMILPEVTALVFFLSECVMVPFVTYFLDDTHFDCWDDISDLHKWLRASKGENSENTWRNRNRQRFSENIFFHHTLRQQCSKQLGQLRGHGFVKLHVFWHLSSTCLHPELTVYQHCVFAYLEPEQASRFY